jgi:glycosyltransferase involved in cell wall biosynthesis
MTQIFMHVDHLSERGSTTALYEYAKCLSQLGHEISIFYQKNSPYTNLLALAEMSKFFYTHGYSDFYEINNKFEGQFEYAYFLKGGESDGKLIDGAKNYVHSMFQFWEPHGDSYAYVSAWLADTMRRKQEVVDRKNKFKSIGNVEFNFVPHIVDMPKTFQNIRKKIGVPEDAICGVRIGGKDSFDIPWVHWAIEYMAKEYGFYFIFVNTSKFSNHKNIIYLDTITDKQYKADLLSSADFFIHGRSRGESFGISIIEALQLSIPVLAWSGGIDKNHTVLLDSNYLYKDCYDLIRKMRDIEFKNLQKVEGGIEFRPNCVMTKFLEIFPIL